MVSLPAPQAQSIATLGTGETQSAIENSVARVCVGVTKNGCSIVMTVSGDLLHSVAEYPPSYEQKHVG